MKSWKNKCRIRFLRKNFVECQMKSGEKMTCWNKKGLIKKYIYHVWKWSKKKKFFYKKMFVRIKDDQDSVTRPKDENWKNEKMN